MKIIVLTFFLILQACSAIQSQEKKTIKEEVLGAWQWVETIRHSRGGGSNETPETCNCTMEMTLEADGTLRRYKNDKMFVDTTYIIEKFEFLDDPIRWRFSGGDIWGDVNFVNGKLALGSFGTCGAIYYFEKKEP